LICSILVEWLFGFFNHKAMTCISRFLAVVSIAALLAPGVRWIAPAGPADTCACPPAVCVCIGHHHVPGKLCCMGKSGRCGLGSQDDYVNSLLRTLIFMPAEHHGWGPTLPWIYSSSVTELAVLPSHARIPELPPRTTSLKTFALTITNSIDR
jgi:hypothetical protein